MRKLLLLLMLGCTACTSQAQDPGRNTPPTTPSAPVAAPAPGQDTLARLRAAVGSAACTDSSQCRTLPLGARACGGPEGYLAYSTAGGKEATLRALAEQHQQEARAANAQSGMVSTCLFIPDPGAVCTAGTCQLGSARNAAS